MDISVTRPLLATAAAGLLAALALASCGGSSATSSAQDKAKLLAEGSACGSTWSENIAYVAGNTVSYQGITYTANWWTQGNNPAASSGPAGSGQPWTAGGSCNSQACNNSWNAAVAYTTGNTVSYDGRNYTANWWTQNNNPSTSNGVAGSGQPWTAGGNCQAATTSTSSTSTTTTLSTVTSSTVDDSFKART